jgi:hypothetical protein
MFRAKANMRDGKAPSSNIQAPEKLQTTSAKKNCRASFGIGSLEFLWMLELGAWSFFSPCTNVLD